MNRLGKLGVVAFAYALLAGGPGAATEPETDANLVTGLDFSHSVSFEEHRLVQEGLAQALLSPEFLHAIHAGRHGRIGFAVFGWHTTTIPLLPWMLIGSADDARLAVDRIRAAIMEQVVTEAALRRAEGRFGRPTDLSHALSSASAMLLRAPFAPARSVINIVGNGTDNVNEGPRPARDVALGLGFTVNGVVLGADLDLVEYFRRNVAGGSGSFVVCVPEARDMAEVLTRKLLNDIIVGFRGGPEPGPGR